MHIDQIKTLFWSALALLVAVVIFCIVIFIGPTFEHISNSLPVMRTITVSAEGKTTVTPDLAESSFSVVSRGVNPTELADNNNQKVSAVIQFLKSEKVTGNDIKTTGYNLSPDYRYDQNTGRNFITGYTLTQTVNVKMRDFARVPEIIAGLTPLGVNEIGGINFSVEEPEKVLAEARTKAIATAREKAFMMAQESGARLGKVVSIAEYQGGMPIPYESFGAKAMSADRAPAPVAPPTIEPGTQEVKDDVTIVYELR